LTARPARNKSQRAATRTEGAGSEFDNEAVAGKEFSPALGPFDDQDALFSVVPEAELVEVFDVIDAVKVDMVEGFSALVLVHEHK
jgi:hypothetical protein